MASDPIIGNAKRLSAMWIRRFKCYLNKRARVRWLRSLGKSALSARDAALFQTRNRTDDTHSVTAFRFNCAIPTRDYPY